VPRRIERRDKKTNVLVREAIAREEGFRNRRVERRFCLMR
jgi:hypothetical protein